MYPPKMCKPDTFGHASSYEKSTSWVECFYSQEQVYYKLVKFTHWQGKTLKS